MADAKFWQIDLVAEGLVVAKVLRQRFPDTWRILSGCLEQVDPFEIVYPGSPDEYSDVVKEVLVLLADVNADLVVVDRPRLVAVLGAAFARCFDETPAPDVLGRIADLVVATTRDTTA